jgi:hypothetical protein
MFRLCHQIESGIQLRLNIHRLQMLYPDVGIFISVLVYCAEYTVGY